MKALLYLITAGVMSLTHLHAGVIDPSKPYYYTDSKQHVEPKKLKDMREQRQEKKKKVDRIQLTVEPEVELKGTLSLYRALSILASSSGINVVIDKDVDDAEVSLAVKGKIGEVVDSLCKSADVWCYYYPVARRLEVKKYRDIVIDIDPEGRVAFAFGRGMGGWSGSASTGGVTGGNSGSGQIAGINQQMWLSAGGFGGGGQSATPVSYTALNIPAEEFLTILSQYMRIKYYPSPSGYVVAKVTPSQWEDVKRFFDEKRKREEVVQVEVKLLRVDLKDEFRWGINWSAILSGFRVGSVTRLVGGVSLNPLVDEENQPQGAQGTLAVLTKDGDVGGIISALSEYGKVHTVDTWVYQMKTGTPIPFGNYRTVTYFTVGASQTQTSTEIIAEPHQEIIGFTGTLAVFKKENGYYVEGFVDISNLLGFVTQNTPYGELRAPEKEGKNFRISTYLSDLDRILLVGGFRTSGISSKDQGVPLLSKIPVLGWLFKYKEDLSQNSEFVVLISLKKAKELRSGEETKANPLLKEPSRLIEERKKEVLEEEEDEDLL